MFWLLCYISGSATLSNVIVRGVIGMRIMNSGVTVFLVSAKVEGASHTYSHLSQSNDWQKPIAHIWENEPIQRTAYSL